MGKTVDKVIRVKAPEIRMKAQEVCGVLGRSCGVSVSVRLVCSFPHITADARFLYLLLGHNFDHDTPTHCTCQKKRAEGRGRHDKERCIFTPPIAVANHGKKTQKKTA